MARPPWAQALPACPQQRARSRSGTMPRRLPLLLIGLPLPHPPHTELAAGLPRRHAQPGPGKPAPQARHASLRLHPQAARPGGRRAGRGCRLPLAWPCSAALKAASAACGGEACCVAACRSVAAQPSAEPALPPRLLHLRPTQAVVTAGKEGVLNERRWWAHFGRPLVIGCSGAREGLWGRGRLQGRLQAAALALSAPAAPSMQHGKGASGSLQCWKRAARLAARWHPGALAWC